MDKMQFLMDEVHCCCDSQYINISRVDAEIEKLESLLNLLLEDLEEENKRAGGQVNDESFIDELL